MELLLNLVWIALAIGAFLIFGRRQQRLGRKQSFCWQSFLALACVLLLLFPVISASDDLHPSQALLEDATRRAQHLAIATHLSAANSAAHMLPMLLGLGLLFALVRLQPRPVLDPKVCVLDGHSLSCGGRAPPIGWN
jgi:hypothetical protein